ncbi:tyrosine-protein phosphatase [Bacteroides sp. 51]|uniref:tyrosine-protein phosphatase n=1 Tax=Bacteroides sp. 51 TaxID=2302938 RepID=UPI0013D48E3B|nr:tyrosine-protein phosphatase [Bacteroides sp. 51]NDV80488.1 tyrosine-protein phosphatase [Bacteroides sp. 51]
MYRQLFGWLTMLLLCPSCSDNSPSISVVCEEDPRVGRGNCIIKWETTPVIEGKVKIYASTDQDKIPEKNPILTADISDQLATIVISDPTQRYYYKMVFNNRYRVVTASRNSVIPGIQNFRDIGGYAAAKGKKTRWGMLYRSAQVESLSYSTFKELKNIGIKTVIDLRTPEEVAKTPRLEEQGLNVVHIPIGSVNADDIMQKVREGKIRNDSIYRLMLRVNREMVIYYRAEYKKMFDLLKEEDNYPAMIVCMSGMDRTAIASAMILSALGVNDETIMSDYLRSNDFFDIPRASGYGYRLPRHAQEAITTLFSAREGFLNAAKSQVEKSYGNIPTYLDKGLGLTEEDIRDLRGVLLH